jgi:pheromone shutdown protein TraB
MEDSKVDKSIKAGVFATSLAIIVNLFVVYVFRLETLKDGLVTVFMTYIFNDGILTTTFLALLYLTNEPYPPITIDTWIILSPIVSAVSAVIAAYIGVWLAKTRKPIQESPQPIPLEMQSV